MTTPAARSRRRRRALLVGVLLVLGGLGLAVLFVVASFSGGFDELLPRDRPTAGDAKVVAARQAGADTVNRELSRVVADVVLPALAPGARQVGIAPADASRNDVVEGSGCEVGQHNWKRDDPYDLWCTERSAAIVVTPDADVRGQLLALDEALAADGWAAAPGQWSLRDLLEGRNGAPPPDAADPAPRVTAYLRRGGSDQQLVVTTGTTRWTGAPEASPSAAGRFPLVLELAATSFER